MTFLFTLVLLLLAGPLVALAQTPAWTFVQSSYYDNHGNGLACTANGGCVGSSGSTCSVNSATCNYNMRQVVKPGDVLVSYSEIYNTRGVITTLSSISGETSSGCPLCRSTNSGVTQDVRLVASAAGGESNFTCTFSSASNGYQGCGIIELSTTYTSVSLDTGGTSMTVCGTRCAGIPLTTAASDAIIQTIFPYNDYDTAISSPYSTVCAGASSPDCSGIGVAYILNTSMGSQSTPGWTVGSNEPVQMNAIALKGATGNSGGPVWTFVQEGYWSNFGAASGSGGSNCGAPLVGTLSCTVNLPHTVRPRDVLIILPFFYSGDVITLTSITGEVITKCTACQLLNYTAIQLDAGYVLSAVGGENQITCHFSAATTGWQACAVIEANWSGTSVTFDAGNAALVPCSTVCPGVSLPLTGNTDFIIQSNFPFFTNPLSVSSPYTFFQGSYGYLLNAIRSQGGAPIWMLPQADPATSNNAIALTGH
jgi:hypothetical protein